MESNFIHLHLPGGAVKTIHTSHHQSQLLDFFPNLLSRSKIEIPGTGFWLDLGASRDTHMFIAREKPSTGDRSPHCLMDMFAIEVRGGAKMSSEDVFNSARSTFQHEFSAEDNQRLTEYYYPNSRSVDDQGYPCGTIFTIGPVTPTSNSSSMTIDRPPLRNFSSSMNSDLSDHRSPNTDHRSPSSNLPIPTIAENSSNEANSASRKGKVHEDPIARIQLDEGHKTNPFPNIVGYTGTEPMIQMTTEGSNLSDGNEGNEGNAAVPTIKIEGVPSPTENMSESGRITMHPHEESKSADSSTSSKRTNAEPGGTQVSSGGAKLVVGTISSRDQRPDSLHVLNAPKRRSSDPTTNLSVLDNDVIRPRSNSMMDRSPVPLDLSHVEPARPVLHRSLSGPPTTPMLDPSSPLPSCDVSVKPPGVQRQLSRGENEIVVGTFRKKLSQTGLPNIAVTAVTDLVPELPPPQPTGNFVSIEEIPAVQVNGNPAGRTEAVLPGEMVGFRPEAPAIDRSSTEEEVEDVVEEEESGDVYGSSSETLSEKDVYQVHLLGHACNKLCNKPPCLHGNDPSFASGVEQMSDLVSRLIQHNESTDDLRRYISIHCDIDCPGVGCKVPHLAAGCLPPTVPRIRADPAPSPPLLFSPTSPPLRGLSGASVDQIAAFDSTTPPDEENARPGDLQIGTPARHLTTPQYNATPTPNQEAMRFPAKRFRDFMSPHPWTPSPPAGRNEGGFGGGAGGEQYPHKIPENQLPQFPSPSPQQQLFQRQHQQTPPSPLQQHRYKEQVRAGPFQSRLEQQPPRHGAQPPPYPGGQPRPQPRVQPPPHPLQMQDFGHHHADQVDQGHAHLRTTPRHREQYYYQFQRYDRQGTARMQHAMMWQGTKDQQKLPDVLLDGFPSNYSGVEPGTIIYSSEDVLVKGFCYPLPCMDKDKDKLGKGGNGKVSKHYINHRMFAVKATKYRDGELNIWKKLHHSNLVPLLGVMVGRDKQCYQFMPHMTRDLGEVIRKTGCMKKLSEDEGPCGWELVKKNMHGHILVSVLMGLEKLEELNMQHCDVKASNILIRQTCSCPDVLHCKCPKDDKCQVMLADYDSIKEMQRQRNAQSIPQGEWTPKSPEQLKKVMGTVAYRAPEKFYLPVENVRYPECYLEGPWCDWWSLGMVIARLTLGKDTLADKQDANILKGQPHLSNLTLTNEVEHAVLKQKAMYQAAASDPNLKVFADLADACLQLDFRKRLRPRQLLDIMMVTQPHCV